MGQIPYTKLLLLPQIKKKIVLTNVESGGEIMELKEAIITEDKNILCPYCKKKNGELTGEETIRNFKIRCRGSNARLEHFFMLNVERGQD